MKCTVIPLDLKLRREFIVAGGKSSTKRNFILVIEDIGLGEAAGSVHYGPDTAQMEMELDLICKELQNMSPIEIDEYLPGLRNRVSVPVLCAVSTAWLDFRSKKNRKPLHHLLGLPQAGKIKTSATVSLGDTEGLGRVAAEGFELIKIKMDKGKAILPELLNILKQNHNLKIRIDANGSWNLEDSIEILTILPRDRIELIEQPFPGNACEDWRKLKDMTDIPCIMDEGIADAEDVKKVASYVDGVNIKIQKAGLLETAREAMKQARKSELSVMLGCMVESSIGIAAACHLAYLADYFDLDGRWLLESDPFVGLDYDKSSPVLYGKYGHGVTFA